MSTRSGLPWVWGATSEEASRSYPADTVLTGPVVTMTRAIDVAAPVATTWRWLCQISVAPYSYDLIDNLGRRSPRSLTPGADQLTIGQPMAKVFGLVCFEDGHQFTCVTRGAGVRMFGQVAMTYAAEPGLAGSRIVVRLAAATGPLARWRALGLAWGDLVMMRKQLHVLRDLAEAT